MAKLPAWEKRKNWEDEMKKGYILKDVDSLCRDLIPCIQSSEQLLAQKSIDKIETAEKISGMVVNIGSLLLELRQSKIILAGETKRLNVIAQLSSSCKNLEGMVKEMRNDLQPAAGEPVSNRERG